MSPIYSSQCQGGLGEDLCGVTAPSCCIDALGTLCRGAELSGRDNADLLAERGGHAALKG